MRRRAAQTGGKIVARKHCVRRASGPGRSFVQSQMGGALLEKGARANQNGHDTKRRRVRRRPCPQRLGVPRVPGLQPAFVAVRPASQIRISDQIGPGMKVDRTSKIALREWGRSPSARNRVQRRRAAKWARCRQGHDGHRPPPTDSHRSSGHGLPLSCEKSDQNDQHDGTTNPGPALQTAYSV